mgnify:CR=1 FL=1
MSPMLQKQFPNISAAIAAFQAGRPVLLLDDDDREDEADIIAAAENITLQTMAMMIRDCSGIVCLCLDEATVDELQLAPMVQNNQARHGTGFFVAERKPGPPIDDTQPWGESGDGNWRQFREGHDELLKLGCGWLPNSWRATTELAQAVRLVSRGNPQDLLDYCPPLGLASLRQQLHKTYEAHCKSCALLQF